MRRVREDPEDKERNGPKFLPGFRYVNRFGLLKEIQISATPLLLLFLALAACERNSVTAPPKLAPVPANTRVAEGENCLYDVFADDLVCWGAIGDWGDQWGVPFPSGEVSADDPATWSSRHGWSDADGYVSNGALDYPWNGKPPSAFEPHWWGYRDQTWYLDFGYATNDNYVPIGSVPKPRPLLPAQQPQHLWKNSAVAAPPARDWAFGATRLSASKPDYGAKVHRFRQSRLSALRREWTRYSILCAMNRTAPVVWRDSAPWCRHQMLCGSTARMHFSQTHVMRSPRGI